MKVNIKCKQVVEYDQTVEMSEEDFEALSDIFGDDVSERYDLSLYYILEGCIDPADICSADMEYLSVEVEASEEN